MLVHLNSNRSGSSPFWPHRLCLADETALGC